MSCTEIVAERTYQPNVVEQPPRFPRMAIDPDAALVAQLRRADAGAAEALVGAYGDRVYRLALRITGNASDAEEVVQDALWTAGRKIDTFRGAAAFGSWVYRITANAAYQKLRGRRSQRHEVSWEDVAPAFDERGQHVEVAVDWSRRLKDPAIEGELKSVLSGAIDALPADYRTAFVLHDVEGLSNPEIAQTLQVRLGTVKSRVHGARLFLRRRLADYVGAGLEVLDHRRLRLRQEREDHWMGNLAQDLPCAILRGKPRVHPAGRRPHPNEETEGAIAAARSRGGVPDVWRLPLVEKGRP